MGSGNDGEHLVIIMSFASGGLQFDGTLITTDGSR